MRSIARLLARLLAGLAALAVIVGPVVVVARVAGNPFPTDLLDRLGSRRVDDATIVKVLSLGFYVCWAWFCAPALRQLAAALTNPDPHRPSTRSGGRSPKPRPVEPIGAGPRGLLARLARFAVSGAAIATSAVAPASTVATIASTPPAIVAVLGATAVPSDADAAPARAPSGPVASHTAAHRDTPYAMATKLFPADRVDEARNRIVELNLGRQLPDGSVYRGGGFPAGWSVLIPVAGVPTSSPATDAEPASLDPTADAESPIIVETAPYEAATTITIELDDNLWELSHDRLQAAGAAHDDAAVAGYVQAVIVGNPDVVEDPNLIFAGEQFDFPVIGTPPPTVPPVPLPPPLAADPVVLPPPEQLAPDLPAAPEAPMPTPAPPVTTTATAPTTTTPAPVPPAEPAPLGAEVAASSPSPIGVGEAALLSAGVLALLAARRRHRLRASQPRARVPDPPPGTVAAERRLRTVDAGERLLRLDVGVRAAAATLIDTTAQIAVVQVGSDGVVALTLTDDAVLPAPWEGTGGCWELPGSTPIELLAEAARSVGAPCVALTQLGVDADGRELLVDLEALGVLSIVAPDPLADAVVRGIAATLATSIFAEVANLIGVGLDDGAFLDHRQAHVAPTVDDALELAATLVGTTASAKQSTFVLRARHTSGEAWEPAIVLTAAAAAPELTPELVRSAGRGRGGVAVVAGGDAPGAPWSLRAAADRWVLEPLGISLVPVGLTTQELDELHEVLRNADEPLITDDDELADLPPSALYDEEAGDAESPWSLLVRLLGPVEVVDATGTPASFERSKTLELIAWLTLHRERSTRAGARTALWELDVRDATFANVVSEARRAMARLLEPPDQEEWLGRTLTDVLPLHAEVVSDADLVRQRLQRARMQPPELAIETLRPAVELIRDLPFAGTGYLWPDAEGITSNLVLLATSAATELAGHHLSMGDVDGVFWATGQGLKVLPGHEELIALRMRAHARAGDLSGVRLEWESYERVLNADPWSDGEPAPKLVLLRRELLSS